MADTSDILRGVLYDKDYKQRVFEYLFSQDAFCGLPIQNALDSFECSMAGEDSFYAFIRIYLPQILANVGDPPKPEESSKEELSPSKLERILCMVTLGLAGRMR